MNSPRSKKADEFDFTIGHELKSWSAYQQAPTSVRENLLNAAAKQANEMDLRTQQHGSGILKQFQRWLERSLKPIQPETRYHDLSQWLFSQAAWHNLGNDRRAMRFVC